MGIVYLYAKSFFNPLSIYPIIQTQAQGYIVPSSILFIRKAYNLFWHFEELIGDNFREKIFDKLFESYVGDLLKNIFGKDKVQRIENYKNSKLEDEFFDWIVEDTEHVYLIETKAYSLNLANYQTGDITKQVLDKIIKKPVCQMFKRIKDLESGKYNKINKFLNKNIIPIAIYYNIPYVSGDAYSNKIAEVMNNSDNEAGIQKAIGNENKIEEFKKFKYYLLNIQELECYQDIKSKITLSECLISNKKDKNLGNSFEGTLRKLKGNNCLKSPFLEKEMDSLWNQIIN